MFNIQTHKASGTLKNTTSTGKGRWRHRYERSCFCSCIALMASCHRARDIFAALGTSPTEGSLLVFPCNDSQGNPGMWAWVVPSNQGRNAHLTRPPGVPRIATWCWGHSLSTAPITSQKSPSVPVRGCAWYPSLFPIKRNLREKVHHNIGVSDRQTTQQLSER